MFYVILKNMPIQRISNFKTSIIFCWIHLALAITRLNNIALQSSIHTTHTINIYISFDGVSK
ncbi:hypothetical protein QTP88_005884 [Uroleucon formosanum]